MTNGRPAFLVALAVLATLLVPAVAQATTKLYVLPHPKREHCRAHYVKEVEAIQEHGKTVRVTICLYVATWPLTLPPLSLATARSIATQYAESEGHRIFRVADLYATAECSRSRIGSIIVGTYERYGAECVTTLSLCYSTEPEIEPVRLEAQLFVWKTGPGRFQHKLEQEWEVLPAGDRGSTEHPPETLTVEGQERTISNWC